MRIKRQPSGYIMWLSANNTYDWAHRVDNRWPCSELSNHRLCVVVDNNGICDMTFDGATSWTNDIDGTELDAIVSDHLPTDLRHLWPCWEVRV